MSPLTAIERRDAKRAIRRGELPPDAGAMLFRALEENRIYEQNLHNHRALLRRLAEKIGGELTAEIEEFLARPIDWDTSKDTREK